MTNVTVYGIILHVDEWWRLFGTDAHILQKLAIRLLSQTASSSGCERNWSLFDAFTQREGISWSTKD